MSVTALCHVPEKKAISVQVVEVNVYGKECKSLIVAGDDFDITFIKIKPIDLLKIAETIATHLGQKLVTK